MLIDNPQVVEGSVIINATVASGSTLPLTPNPGELFYLTTGAVGLYSYSGSAWEVAAKNVDLVAHIGDATKHLSTAENALIDAISVTADDINSIPTLTSQGSSTSTALATHVANTAVHLSSAQNTLLDALDPLLTAADVSTLVGVTGPVQPQLDAITSDITVLENTTQAQLADVQDELDAHEADDTRHLTSAENTLIDGITVSATEINKLAGIGTFLGGSALTAYLTEQAAAKLNVDGSNALTANLNAGGFRIVNAGDPTSSGQVATKNYVDAQVGGALPDVGTPGTYRSVTTDAKGRVTAGTNPTTVAAYGITDAQPLQADLTAITEVVGTGVLRKTGAATWELDTDTGAGGNEEITISGDATGTGTTAITLTLTDVGLTGTYKSVTTDAKGRVIAGTNPTTLALYGITDAQALDADLTAIGALSGTSGFLKKTAANTWALDTSTYLTTAVSTFNTRAGAVTLTSGDVTTALGFTPGTSSFDGAYASLTGTPTLATVATSGDYNDLTNLPSGGVADANALTGTILASNVVTSSLTTVGTLSGLTVTAPIAGSVTGAAGSVPAAGITGTILASNIVTSSLTTVGTLSGLTVTAPITGSVTGAAGSVSSNDITGTILASNVVTSSLTTTGTLSGLTVTTPITGSVTGAAGSVPAAGITGTILASNVVTSSLTTVGTLSGLTVTAPIAGSVTGAAGSVAYANITSKPTTIAGYGITDAQAVDGDLTAIAALSGTSGILKKTAADTWTLVPEPVLLQLACSDETTALTAGVGKVTFRAPYAFTLTGVRASVNTAPTGGTLLTIDINEAGTSVLSTKLTFNASEKTTVTAATAAVISDASIADDAEISIDIDSIGSTIAGAGLKVTLIGTKP